MGPPPIGDLRHCGTPLTTGWPNFFGFKCISQRKVLLVKKAERRPEGLLQNQTEEDL